MSYLDARLQAISSHHGLAEFSQALLQAISSDHGLSEFSKTLSRVPQSSILGPKSFLLLNNDLLLSVKHCLADFFADDNTIHVSGKNKADFVSQLQSDGTNTGAWSKRNNLPINYDKSTLMLLVPDKRFKILKIYIIELTTAK